MTAIAMPHAHKKRDADDVDHVVVMQRTRWRDYERFDELREESARPRLTYYKGALEIMSPSYGHEDVAFHIGRLVEAFCDEMGIEFSGVGSWTLKDEQREAAAEPDACYIFKGRRGRRKRPDLAIEVEWSRRILNKLDVYRALGVREVWVWAEGAITIWLLGRGGFAEGTASKALPGIDVAELCSFLDRPTTSAAVREYRRALRARRR